MMGGKRVAKTPAAEVAARHHRPGRLRVPKRPRLVVRIGITGHRPNRLGALDRDAASRSLAETFATVRDAAEAVRLRHSHAFADLPVAVRVISSLAEGADRLAAEVALAHGYELNCIFPFPSVEYERDFSGAASIDEFRGLRARAHETIELDGTHAGAVAAYEEASLTVLRQVDVLVALWDGEQGSGHGGTAHTVERAAANGIPTVWIPASPPHEPRVLTEDAIPPQRTRPLLDVADEIVRLVEPPGDANDPAPRAYYLLRLPGPRPVGLFRRFRALLLGGVPPRAAGARPTGDEAMTDDYHWADRLANHFAEYYRDAFTANYLLAALAVLLAAVGFLRLPGAALGELIVIVAILWITRSGRRGRWHENWLAYRLLGERFRTMLFLRPLACAVPRFPARAHMADAHAPFRWASWLFQARAREAPMVAASFDRQYRDSNRILLGAAIADQVAFHRSAATRQGQAHHRIHAVGTTLFAATAVVCLAHILVDPGATFAWVHGASGLPRTDRALEVWLGIAAAALPAFGAALTGIDNHAEFARVAERSKIMAATLKALGDELAGLDDPSSGVLRRVAERAADMMISELLDWQLIFWGKPIVLPT